MTLAECVQLHEAAQAERSADRPIRVLRAACLRTAYWRADVGFLARVRRNSLRSPAVIRCRTLAETGEHLGLDRVGLVVETLEVTS